MSEELEISAILQDTYCKLYFLRERNSLKYEAINLTVVGKFSCH